MHLRFHKIFLKGFNHNVRLIKVQNARNVGGVANVIEKRTGRDQTRSFYAPAFSLDFFERFWLNTMCDV